jgi:hypothetical protein
MSKKDRPLGITIISILVMFIGTGWMLGGIFILLGSTELAELIEDTLGSGVAALAGVLGIVILITGLLVFLEGLGLWKLNFIAYLIYLVLLGINVLGIIMNYKYYLALIISDLFFALLNPFITILLFIYFIQIRDHF